MADPLLSVPGLGGYLAQRQRNEQLPMQELQQATQAMGLMGALRKQAVDEQYRQAIAGAQSPEEQAAVAARFGGPEAVMRHADRQAQIGATREAARMRLQQSAEQFGQRLTLQYAQLDQAERQGADRNAIARYRAMLDAAKADFSQRLQQEELRLTGAQSAYNYGAAMPTIPALNVPTPPAGPAAAQGSALPAGVPESDRAAYEIARAGGSASANRQMTPEEIAGLAVMPAGAPAPAASGAAPAAAPAPAPSATRPLDALSPRDRRNLKVEYFLVNGEMTPAYNVGGKIIHAQTQEDLTGSATPATGNALRIVGGADKARVRADLAGELERTISELEQSVATAPRRTVGPLSGVARTVEGVVGAVAGTDAFGSQANVAEQSRQRLITLLGQVGQLNLAKASNKDMERIQASLGANTWSTPEAFKKGLADIKDVVAILKAGEGQPSPLPRASGQGAPSTLSPQEQQELEELRKRFGRTR